jgi:hypothetical protein
MKWLINANLEELEDALHLWIGQVNEKMEQLLMKLLLFLMKLL